MKNFIILFAIVGASLANARLIPDWNYAVLAEKSDLILIATPIKTDKTDLSDAVGSFANQPVVASVLLTTFSVQSILKGNCADKEIVLRHLSGKLRGATTSIYEDASLQTDGPSFVSFDPKVGAYIMFLVRLENGQYASVSGQMDPSFGIKLLEHCAGSEKENVEQFGADQPATAPESKSEGKDKPQPESKPVPR